jgi:hypothetical protein
MTSFMLTYFSCVLCPQFLSQGSTDVPTLLATECERLSLATETSAWEVAAAWDSAPLCGKDAEDRAALVECNAMEWLSRAELENATVLASACEDAKWPVWRVAILEDKHGVECLAREMSKREHRAHFEELTLLHAQGSELCQAIVGLPWAKRHLFMGMQLAALRHNEMTRELAAF